MKFEYKVINMGVMFSTGKGAQNKVQEACDIYSKDGWELVNFQFYDADSKVMLVFKKEV